MRPYPAERFRPTIVLALAGGLLLSACASTPADKVRISVKRIALSLAFENEDNVEPVAPEEIIRVIPAPPELVASGDLTPFRSREAAAGDVLLPLPPEPPLCASAPEGAPSSTSRRSRAGTSGSTAGS
jgi:hypothetical protein